MGGPPESSPQPPATAELPTGPASAEGRNPARSGVWGLIGLVLVALLLTILVQVVVGFVGGFIIGFRAAVGGQRLSPHDSAQAVQEFITGPVGLGIAIVMSQAVFLGAALFGVRRLPSSLKRDRLGLRRPGVPVTAYPVLVLGSVFVAALGNVFAGATRGVSISGFDADALHRQLTWTTGVWFLVAVTLPPGFAEEMLFRGYVQRRLLRRWRAGWAILFTSAVFAIVHLEPVQVVFALPVGLWLGIVAWRAGSIWPSVVCHAFINLFVNLGRICALHLNVSGATLAEVGVGIFAAGLVGFLASLILLRRMRPPAIPVEDDGETAPGPALAAVVARPLDGTSPTGPSSSLTDAD